MRGSKLLVVLGLGASLTALAYPEGQPGAVAGFRQSTSDYDVAKQFQALPQWTPPAIQEPAPELAPAIVSPAITEPVQSEDEVSESAELAAIQAEPVAHASDCKCGPNCHCPNCEEHCPVTALQVAQVVQEPTPPPQPVAPQAPAAIPQGAVACPNCPAGWMYPNANFNGYRYPVYNTSYGNSGGYYAGPVRRAWGFLRGRFGGGRRAARGGSCCG